ncbi:glycoside hydrolase family 3 protein [Bdellovibrio bacteriovorus]|uniref:glycoside hydrolase family 3 protein n=1 Tax=Bdellovibrio bacteriovorus TaxID=959 RepID=UPI0021D22D33|nr:glycoside hydrolase family 3 protein [Bdellovibrio bacteriovorus]UXR65758.1 glycoside hydrolase family 3 protein [Bdellovibrio bacteriovorus]
MTPEEKVGQLFIVGFPYTEITPELESFMKKYKPGSFLLFKRNITSATQIRDLNLQLYKASYRYSKLPPFIAIDQEGGAVSRLPITPAPPNALAIGQTQSPLLAEEMGHQTGLFLREVGFNMNLAPVLDVVDPYSTSFIGVRSFGSDPELVRDIGVAYSKGLLKARVIPTAKHFPGTGSLNQDPHVTVVENKTSLETFKKRDLVPFIGYSKLGQNIAVMMSHLIYPELDSTREPASFSRRIAADLLRDDLKYQGLVMTDDLQMQGSKQVLRPEAAALKALKSGSDIVMLTWSFADQGKAFDYVLKALQDEDLSAREVDSKLRRILRVKAFANVYRKDPKVPSLLSGNHLTSADYASVEDEVLSQNLKTSLIPRHLPPAKIQQRKPASTEKVCAASPSMDFLNSFSEGVAMPNLHLRNHTSSADIISWIKKHHCMALFVGVTGPRTARQIRGLTPDSKSKIIVVNLGAPRLFPRSRGYRQVIQLYFNHKDAGKKIAKFREEILQSSQGTFALKD